MLLDFSKIELGADGRPEPPTLVLRTLAEQTLGVISGAYNVRFDINLSDLSTIEFTVPYMTDGVVTPLYDQIVGYKVVYTSAYGIYVLTRPEITGDGVKEVKQVTGYSLEYLREKKQLFLEEGLYKFWNVHGERQDTILGRVVEAFPGWEVSCTDTKLIDTYRYFDQTEVDALSFCYSDVADKFHCVIAFDVYSKTIHAFDANSSLGMVPIYLSFDNLVQSVSVTELTDEIKTKLHVYGADDLSIASVNPTGTDYIVDLQFFVERGDLNIKVGDSDKTLADRYFEWQHTLLGKQERYSNLVASKSALSLQLLMLEAELVERQGELEELKTSQNIEIQASAAATTEESKAAHEKNLSDLADKIDNKEDEIRLLTGVEDPETGKMVNGKIPNKQAEIDDATQKIVDEVNTVKMSSYFSPAELSVLEEFLIEGDIVEETFVASDIDTTVDGVSSSLDGAVSIKDCEIVRIEIKEPTELYEELQLLSSGGNVDLTNRPRIDTQDLIDAGYDDAGDGYATVFQQTFSTADELKAMNFTPIMVDEGGQYIGVMDRSEFSGYCQDVVDGYHTDNLKLQIGGAFTGENAIELAVEAAIHIHELHAEYYDESSGGMKDFELIKTMYGLAGGSIEFAESDISIVRGTAEIADSQIVMSVYLGKSTISGKTYNEGTLIITGNVANVVSDIETKTDEDGIEEDVGTALSFVLSNPDTNKSNLFLSASTNEYKTFSVARNLFDYGVESLADLSTPTYEFSIDSTNFLFLNEFAQFKNQFELGKGIYLSLSSEGVIKPNVIGVGVDFSNESKLELAFSNRYKKKNGFKTLESMIKKSYSSSRDFDASKYILGKTVNQASNVSDFMNKNFETAKNTIVGAKNQSVVIDSAGISVTNKTNPEYQLRIVDGMIAMTKDGWQTSDVAIGYFNGSSETSDKLGGVNAQLLAGRLIVGNNLVIESNDAAGEVKSFRVDGSGAWLSNSTFILQDGSGQILIDPENGIVAGKDVFTLNETNDGITANLYKSGSEGTEYHDDIGFHLNIKDGSAYFQGEVQATTGSIGGWTIGENQLYSGNGSSFVALNSSADKDGLYAIWAGANTPASAPFSVKRDGTIVAKGKVTIGDEDDYTHTPEIFNSAIYAPSIEAPYIEGGEIVGGIFKATGQGRKNDPAYYIYNGNTMIGYISYDDQGAGDGTESANRIIFKALNVPIKIESGNNMSLSVASGHIYMNSHMALNGALWGPEHPQDVIDDPVRGQIYFMTDG